MAEKLVAKGTNPHTKHNTRQDAYSKPMRSQPEFDHNQILDRLKVTSTWWASLCMVWFRFRQRMLSQEFQSHSEQGRHDS